MTREIQPDDFIAADGSIQTLSSEDYAEAAEAMLDATETPQDLESSPDLEKSP